MNGEITKLHQFIVDYFNLQELKTLCFNLRVNYDTLPGEELVAKSRELIITLGRQGRFEDLLALLHKERPAKSMQIELIETSDLAKVLYEELLSFSYHLPSERESFEVYAEKFINQIE